MKGRRIFCIATLLLALLCGCTARTAQELPQLVIGSDEYRPYNYRDEDGNPAGIDVELAQEACRRMGYEPVFKLIDWNERNLYLAAGEVDCIWNCFAMDGREEEYAWVGPYMYSRQVAAVLQNSEMQHLPELKDKNIAVRASSKAETIFLEHTDENIPIVRNVYCMNELSEVITAMRNNYVDACAGPEAALREQMELDNVPYRFLEEDLTHGKVGIAFAKDSDAALRTLLAETLEEMREDGTTERILQKYGIDTDKALGRF